MNTLSYRLARIVSLALIGLLPAARVIAGTWSEAAPTPVAVVVPSAASLGNNLYLSGGVISGPSASLYVYNAPSNSWNSAAPMPGPRYISEGAGVIGNKVYVAGGWTATPPLPNNNLWAYDTTLNSWTNLAAMPQLSAEGASGVISNELYVTTPDDGYSGYYNFLDVYNPASNSWTALPSSAEAHSQPGFGVISNKFYVVGGVNDAGIVNGELEAYDPSSNAWKTLSPMPTAREGVASAVLNGRLYVFGGDDGDGNILNTVEVYNPQSDSWSTETPMPTARTGAAAAAIGQAIYVVGGSDGKENVATNELFIPSAILGINMYAGLTISGSLGSTNEVQYKNNLHDSNWTTLATIILTTNPYLYVDTNSTFSGRVYRTVMLP